MSPKRRAHPRDTHDTGPPENDVYDALVSLGWIVPPCDDDVARAEADLSANPVDLPDELQDASAVFSRDPGGAHTIPVRLPFSGSPYIDATLARAAREGGEMTPEIEAGMRRDRHKAERDAEDEATRPNQ